LTPGSYTVSTASGPILIDRSGITLSGGGALMTDTKVVRDIAYTDDLIRIGSTGVSVSGVGIKNLTVCGASNITPNWGAAPPSPVGCPRSATVCGDRTIAVTKGNNIFG